MSDSDRARNIKALAERSIYVENVLIHSFVAKLSSVVWSRNPEDALQVFYAEVGDSGFDVVLGFLSQVRYVQLKQAHDEKEGWGRYSVRLSFSDLPGSCVVLRLYSLCSLVLASFRFLGSTPDVSMPDMTGLRVIKSPGRRNLAGEQKSRAQYRDVPIRRFRDRMSAEG